MDRARDLRWPFEVDLGELCDGHRVVTLGIGQSVNGDELHYLFKPGMTTQEQEGRPFFWYWSLGVTDDVGTEYADHDGGAFDESGGDATHGTRDIGGVIPPEATRLTLRFEPASEWTPDGWTPSGAWVRSLVVDLRNGEVSVEP